MAHLAYEMNLEAAKLAKAACARYSTPEKPRFVAGALGPTPKTASISPGRQRPGRTQRQLRPAGRGLRRTGARPARRRRRPAAGRDDLRHAQRQGRDLRDRGAVRRARSAVRRRVRSARARAGDHQRHGHRRVGPDPLGPDRRGVLALGAPCAADRRRPQLRARRRADAPLYRRARRRGRRVRQRLSERRPAEPDGRDRLRRDAGRHLAAAQGVRRGRVRQHRRRLLRHDAGSHPRDRPGDRGHRTAHGAGARPRAQALGARAGQDRRQRACSSTSASAPTSPGRRPSRA